MSTTTRKRRRQDLFDGDEQAREEAALAVIKNWPFPDASKPLLILVRRGQVSANDAGDALLDSLGRTRRRQFIEAVAQDVEALR